MEGGRTGARIVVDCLLEQGVDTVFGYPGGNILQVYDELDQRRDRITHILTAHEQGACHAADGYARSTGRPGVVIATSGPGAANLITGIATAYMDSVPMVILTGNVPTPWRGKDSFQEIDMLSLSMSVTKHNFYVADVEQLEDTLRRAFLIAGEGRPGPVLVDIPKDVQARSCARAAGAPMPRRRIPSITGVELQQALVALCRAEKPFIYAGGGVIRADAAAELREFADRLDAPVACSLMGLGAMPWDDARYTGMVGMHGTPASNHGISQCDLLVVVGARFSDRVMSRVNGFENIPILQIDIDPAEMNKNVRTAVMLQSDVKSALRLLNANLSRQSHPLWCQRVHAFGRVIPRNEAGGIVPGELVRAVAAVCGEDAYVATDVGQHQMWTAQFYPLSAPGRFLTSGGLGTMGFGLGAAIGAQLAHPEATVALFTGDGSFRMNLNELATVAAYGLPIRMILLRNNSLGMIRQWQDASFGGRHSQSDLPALDYCAIARAYGLRAVALEETPGWQERLAEALREPGPVLIECPIRPDNKVLPTVKPGDTLESLALSAHEL